RPQPSANGNQRPFARPQLLVPLGLDPAFDLLGQGQDFRPVVDVDLPPAQIRELLGLGGIGPMAFITHRASASGSSLIPASRLNRIMSSIPKVRCPCSPNRRVGRSPRSIKPATTFFVVSTSAAAVPIRTRFGSVSGLGT